MIVAARVGTRWSLAVLPTTLALCDFDMRHLRRTFTYLLTYLLTYLHVVKDKPRQKKNKRKVCRLAPNQNIIVDNDVVSHYGKSSQHFLIKIWKTLASMRIVRVQCNYT